MRQKTTLYALISLLLTAVIVCGGVWFNHRFPLLPENGSLSGMDLSHAVTLTGWTQTSPGQWRVQFTDADGNRAFFIDHRLFYRRNTGIVRQMSLCQG